jgi:hypothetical protein
LEYVNAVQAGLMRPLSLEEWDDMDREWIETLWDVWDVMRMRELEEAPALNPEEEMQQSLVNLTQRG